MKIQKRPLTKPFIPKVSSDSLKKAMKDTFSPPEWAILFEVHNGTGFAADRSADALAMSLWPSKGLGLYGFELKVSRGDWLRELKDPWKSEAFAKYCDYWSLGVSSPDIVKPGELPEGWGMYSMRGGFMRCLRSPEHRKKPEPIDRAFLAAIVRRSTEGISKDEANRIRSEAHEHALYMHASNEEHLKREVAKLQLLIKEFETRSGIRLNVWNPENAKEVAEAVKFVLASGMKGYHRELLRIDETARSIRTTISKLNIPRPIQEADDE